MCTFISSAQHDIVYLYNESHKYTEIWTQCIDLSTNDTACDPKKSLPYNSFQYIN